MEWIAGVGFGLVFLVLCSIFNVLKEIHGKVAATMLLQSQTYDLALKRSVRYEHAALHGMRHKN